MIRKEGRNWFPLALILLVACTLYFYRLNSESLWIDELFSIHDAQKIELTNPVILHDVKPVYYVLLRLWMLLGESETWLRGLSIPFGLGSVILTYLIGQRLVDKSTGLIAALLLALSPLFINHVQEVRFYPLSVCLNLFGTLVLLYTLQRSQRPQRSLVYPWAVLRALAILTTPLNVALLLSDAAIIGWRFRRQRSQLRSFLEGLVIIGLLCFPAAFSLLTDSGPEYMSSWVGRAKPGIKEILMVLKRFIFYPPYSSELPRLLNLFYKLCTLLAAALLAFSLLRKHRSQNLIWIATWAILPSSLILAISHISSSIWLVHYLLLVCPYILLLLAVGFIRVWRCQAITASAIAIIYALGISGGLYYYYSVPNHKDWRGAIQFVEANEQPDDVIAVYTDIEKVPPAISYYYDGTLPFHFLTNTIYLSDSRTTEEHPALIQELAYVGSESNSRKIVSADRRLWLICFRYCHQPVAVNNLNQIFSTHGFHLKEYHEFPERIHVFLFEPERKRLSLIGSHRQ